VDWIEDRASGTGAIQGTWDDLEVVAEVQVLNALYDRPVAIADLLPWFREQVTPRVHPPKEKAIRLDLRIRANDSLYIDTNYAKAELRGGFRITGTDIKPVVKGRIEVIDGEVEVLDRRFTVTDGEVAFGGGEEINPTLNFTAISSVSTTDTEYQVTAQVLGTLRDYRVLLFADDPSMTTTDVAMLLATGKSPAERQREGTLSTGGMVQLAPALYGDTLRKGVTHYIPVDRFEIEPVYSRSTGNIEPRLTIGKDLTSDLRALVSGTFGVERRNTASLEYRLTPSIVLQGSWESQTTDQAGGFGGDIKFRHEFRHLPFSLWRSIDAEKR
jgi:autotransporter translocation and assembly factor TamB